MRSTGPILATGAITLGNQMILHGKSFDPRIPIATGVAAGMLALIEHVNADLATGIAWIALVTILFVRVDAGVPSPTESLLTWFDQIKTGGTS